MEANLKTEKITHQLHTIQFIDKAIENLRWNKGTEKRQRIKVKFKSREKGAYTYTDLKIRNDIEMSKNQKYFQPKKWNVEKLLYNYDCLFHLWTNARETDNKLIKLLRDHIKNLYRLYNVDPRHRATK